MPIVIIHGPKGCGKTRHAADFLRHYRCTRLVDEWDGKTRLRDGDLAITSTPPPYANSRAALVLDAHVAKAAAARGQAVRTPTTMPAAGAPGGSR